MEIGITFDERYPWYDLTTAYSGIKKVDVPAATVRRWKRVLDQAEKVQEEIDEIYKNTPFS